MAQLVHFGSNVILPLMNHIVTGIHFDQGQVTLLFEQNAHTPRPEIKLAESLVITQTNGTTVNITFEDADRDALGSLLGLMWTEITSSYIHTDGHLILQFSNGMGVEAKTINWQGWAYEGYGQSLKGRPGRWVG